MNSAEKRFITLYTDADVSNLLAALIGQHGFSAISAFDIGMGDEDDETQLQYATDHDMVILTYNGRDFIEIAKAWAEQGKSHTGILISEQFSTRQIGGLLRRTLRFLNSVPFGEMDNQIRFLSEFRA